MPFVGNHPYVRGRRTTSVLSVSCLAALVAAALVTTPAAARSPLHRVTLGGVNVISGDHIVGMPVHIPRPTSVEGDPFSNDNVSYSGAGRVVGLVLVEEGGKLSKASELISVRWSFCGKPGCKPNREDVTEISTSSDWGGKRWRLPAGDYRLYLIADGAPVEVTLRLDGLAGSTSLRPSDHVGGEIAAPASDFVPDPAGNILLGRGDPVKMPAQGLLIDGDTMGFVLGPSVTAQGSCFWRGRGEEDALHSTPGPHCYEFAERGGTSLSSTTIGGGFSAWGIGWVPRGTWQSSYWSANVTAFPQSDFLSLWVPYVDRT